VSQDDRAAPLPCCGSATPCVFAKALLARVVVCERAQRRSLGEHDGVECSSVVARTNCATLAALMHERARFALRLPAPGHPMIHAQALKLHCGGLMGLQRALGATHADVHAMVGTAHARYRSLTDLPWDEIVRHLADWQPHRRRPSPPA
jgi:hypothetical protein